LDSIRDLAVSLLADILRLYSPSKKEETLAQFLKEKMANELDFKNVKTDAVNNVIGEVGEGSPTILLCGHMDTVPGSQPVKVTKELVCGRGAVDAKSSLSAMIMAASSLAKENGFGKIIVAGVADEEGDAQGIRELLKGGIKADYAIFGEPSGVENITIGYKGRLSLRILCETPAVHASAPWMSQNAIEKGLEVWTALSNYLNKGSQEKNRYGTLSACLTKIKGGSADNVMPGVCELVIDVRIPPTLTCEQVHQQAKNVLEKFQEDVAFPKLKIEVGDMTEPFEADKSSPLVRSFMKAIFNVTGKHPMLVKKTGTGDMNILGSNLKIPVVTYGPGNPHLSHTSKECVEISEYLAAIEVYKAAIKNIHSHGSEKA
jgi:LysW-gamma-L-lysine carboxypeptidase